MRRIFQHSVGLVASVLSLVGPVLAQEPPNVEEVVLADPEEHLLGDLGRGKLEADGIRIETFAIHDVWSNVSGGLERGSGIIGNANLIVTLDTGKMGLWEDGAFVFWGLGVYGSRPSRTVGDFQYTSSIDAPSSVELYEGYYQHSFIDGTVDILAGIHDFTLEFAILNYAYTLIGSSFTTPPTITQYPISFYPTTGIGSRTAVKSDDGLYGMVGIYDASPTNYNEQHQRTWSFSKREGIYTIGELGWLQDEKDGPQSKVAFGAWYNSGTFIDMTDQERTGNYGTYFLAERHLWQEVEGSAQGLGVFGQLGQARNDRNVCSWYYGTGISYTGLFPGRDEDVAAIGLADAFFSSAFKDYYDTDNDSERVLEINYRMRVLSSTTITPDVQYVINPYANPDAQDALIVYLRTEIAL
jgi:porin